MEVGGESDEEGVLFDARGKRVLNLYAERNRRLPEWITSPTVVPIQAWPRALAMARAIGPDSVFRVLLKLDATAVGPIKGKRKRKRAKFVLHRRSSSLNSNHLPLLLE